MKKMFHFQRKRDRGSGFCQNHTLTDPPEGLVSYAKKNWLFAYLRPSFLICIFLITGGVYDIRTHMMVLEDGHHCFQGI